LISIWHKSNVGNKNQFYLLLYSKCYKNTKSVANATLSCLYFSLCYAERGVEKPEEYIYSSAKNYADEKGLIDVELIK